MIELIVILVIGLGAVLLFSDGGDAADVFWGAISYFALGGMAIAAALAVVWFAISVL